MEYFLDSSPTDLQGIRAEETSKFTLEELGIRFLQRILATSSEEQIGNQLKVLKDVYGMSEEIILEVVEKFNSGVDVQS